MVRCSWLNETRCKTKPDEETASSFSFPLLLSFCLTMMDSPFRAPLLFACDPFPTLLIHSVPATQCVYIMALEDMVHFNDHLLTAQWLSPNDSNKMWERVASFFLCSRWKQMHVIKLIAVPIIFSHRPLSSLFSCSSSSSSLSHWFQKMVTL